MTDGPNGAISQLSSHWSPGGQKSREVILRKCSDSAEYTPKLVNICSDSMKNTPPYSKVILRKCSDSAEYTPKLVNYL